MRLKPESRGKIAPVTAGNPVQVETDVSKHVASLRFTWAPGQSGNVFVGLADFNKGTNRISPTGYWVDAANNGEGAIVGCQVRQ